MWASTGTIRYWVRKGEIKFEYINGGQRRFNMCEVERFNKRRNVE